jgi:hypothetical protein
MHVRDIHIHIRLALLDLGRDPYIALPRAKTDSKNMLKNLRVEQAYNQKSSMRPEIKERIKQARNDAARAYETSLPHNERMSAAEFSMHDI